MGLQHRWQTKKALFIQCRRPGSLQRYSHLGELLHTSSCSVNAPASTDALGDQSPTAPPSLHLCLSYANVLYFKHNYCGHQQTGSRQHPQPAHMHRSVLNLDMDGFSLSGYMLIGLKTVNLLTVNSGIAEQGSVCLHIKIGVIFQHHHSFPWWKEHIPWETIKIPPKTPSQHLCSKTDNLWAANCHPYFSKWFQVCSHQTARFWAKSDHFAVCPASSPTPITQKGRVPKC